MTTEPDAVVLDAIRNICDHLVERATTLFLGAGVNAQLRDVSGQLCPFGPELSEWICRDLLASPETKVPLDEAVEIARYKFGPKLVNDYIYATLRSFAPPGQLTWRSCNYLGT
jgi:hypothetical protein